MEPQLIMGAYVCTTTAYRQLSLIAPKLQISIDKHLFFQRGD